MSNRMLRCAGIAALSIGLAGCAQVRPKADYQRAGQLVKERVGVERVFEPPERPDPKRPPDAPVIEPAWENSLTLAEALRTAMLHNRELRAMFSDIGIARADLVQSGLLMNPMFGVSVKFPEGGGRSNLMFDFAQQIADLWLIPVRKQAAQAMLDEAVLAAVRRAVELAAAVKQAYHRVQYQREGYRITQENVEVARRSEELARAKLSAAQAGKIDADLARAAWLRAQLALIEVRRRIDLAQNDLALAMGLDRWPAGQVELDPLPADVTAPVSPEAAVAVALEQRLDLLAARREVAAAAARVREQWRRIFPSVKIGLAAERMAMRSMPATMPAEQKAMERQMRIDAMFGPVLSVVLPIFDQNQAQIARAGIAWQQAVYQHEALAQQIQRDVRNAVADYQAAASTVEFHEEQLIPQLVETLETATAAYRAGSATVFVVIEAQRELVDARSTLNMARLEQQLATDELEAALGGPLMRARAAASEVPSTRGAAD